MDISFGQYNNVLDASSITFKKDAQATVEIKFDHATEILHVGKNIELEDKVIVNKNIVVNSAPSGTVNGVSTQLLSIKDGHGNNILSTNFSIEMNIGDKLEFDHKQSPKPVYLTTNNKNDGDTNNGGAGTAQVVTSGVTYISRVSSSGAFTEDTSIATYASNFDAAVDTRTLRFIPDTAGKYYLNFYSDGTGSYVNFYIPVTVSNRYQRVQQNPRDLSFNENISVDKSLAVLGKSNFVGHVNFNDVSLNANTFVSNIEVTDSSFNNLNCAGKTDLSDAFITVGEADTLSTKNPTISNRTFTVTVEQNANIGNANKYKLNSMWNDEVNPVINVGETITFNQDNDSNNSHPIMILTGDIYRGGGGSSDGEVIHGNGQYELEYFVDGTSVGHSVADATAANFSAATERKVVFSTGAPGTYYYQCYAHANMGGSFTVVDRDRQTEVVNKDMSFNGNIDVDFSSNYVAGVNKRMRFIFHPDYTN